MGGISPARVRESRKTLLNAEHQIRVLLKAPFFFAQQFDSLSHKLGIIICGLCHGEKWLLSALLCLVLFSEMMSPGVS